MRALRVALAAIASLLAACATATPTPTPTGTATPNATPNATATPTANATAEIELVESVPEGTTLDRPDVANAPDVWRTMIDRATRTLDFAEFYASEADGKYAASDPLGPVLAAVERATQRGVRVRFLADSVFGAKYPDTLARLERAHVAVRKLDVGKRAGGVLHAKYFVVDGAESFVGSQNFDWRALAHIQEMGVRVRSPQIAGALLDVLDTDWGMAGGAANDVRVHGHASATDVAASTGERLSFVASPKGWLPDEASWDLPRLVEMLDVATRTIVVQLLTYKTKDRDGSAFTTLDLALRRAAARGVHVRMLLSEWSSKPGSDARRAAEDLARVPNVEVRFIVIPQLPGGDIPFARVAHAKYLVVDGDVVSPLALARAGETLPARAWVGTRNWEGDYFLKSRNVGVIAVGGALPGNLARYFDGNWSSRYVTPLAAP